MMDLPPDHLRANRRRGLTLLELLVVVTLMGTLSTVVVTRYGRDIFGDLGARSEAHRLWLDMQRAKSVAIRNGSMVSVIFEKGPSGQYSGYRLAEGPVEKQTVIGEPTQFGADINVTTTSSTIQFSFEGHASTACVVNLKGPNRSWGLTVVPLTGSVKISEI
jgi:prepilin-type N-terminal cleavage/methylation domain-containing protein